MNYFERYKRRITLNGETKRDQIINKQREILESAFEEHPSYQEVYLNGSDESIGLWIIENSNTKDIQEFISIHDIPINAGDLILWNDWQWMVTVKDDKTDIYHKGIISKCIAKLRWLDDVGIVRSTDFTYRNEDLTNFGIDDNRIIVLGNERRHIYVQANEHTKKLKKYKRFIIDNRAWQIISVDRLKKGLIYLVLQEDEIDEARDNIELGIADYVQYQFNLRIMGGENISLSAGQTRQLETQLLRDSEVVSGYELEWESSNPDIVEIDENGFITAIANGSSIITARLKDKPDTYDTIVISVQFAPPDRIAVSINGVDSLIVGDRANYRVTVTNNGIVDPTKQVQWYLYDVDGVSSTDKATFINKQFTQCDIRADKVGKVKLVCVVIGYPTVNYSKEITIKHLF